MQSPSRGHGRQKIILWTGITLALVSVATFFGREWLVGGQPSLPALKVDYPDDPIRTSAWDPARTQMDFESSMVQALYSPLLELDANAQLKSGWAESFSWKDPHTMVLTLRREHRRADGQFITAADAALSLKRAAFLQQDADGFYVEQFCHTKRLKSIQDACPGLKADGQVLTIQTRDPLAILPQLLTAVDTSIVPQAALAPDGVTIQNHAAGSGPYTLDNQDLARTILRANPYHFNYKPDMPQEVHLIPGLNASPESLTEDFLTNRIDHAARFSALNPFEFRTLAENLGDQVNTITTLPMGVGLLLFTPEGRKRHTVEARRQIILRLQGATRLCLASARQDHVRRPTHVLIPPSGVGMLTPAEEASLETARKNHRITILSREVRIRFPNYISEQLVPCLKRRLLRWPVVFASKPDAPVDLRFKSYDLSTYEEVGTIRTMLVTGLLDAGGVSPDVWIRRYVTEQDTQKRVALLKEAHLRSIWTNPAVIPLWNYDTGALIRKPWVMNFSPLSIANPFHLIRYAE
ncbi:ABC transporter substrate-binding protein [Oligoflexus tunisiensis]|uniref:ABC transporter substrate-binding protein n=1 Tax=Oligoflexus tunisiensis TaxID=708132 RepID=UPI00114C88C1|nr:ABC transporter substrate-binding protein [Oligoflexus tunisiensis]